MSELRITVAIPVRDGAAFVEAAVESVLQQSVRDFRLLVLDDASSDRTPEILARLAGRDDRIALIRFEEPRGIASVLAHAVEMSATEYIARLDADDIARADRLASQVAYLDAHPEIGLLGSACAVFDERGPRGLWSMPTDPLAVRWRSLFANPLLHPTVAIRRSVISGAGLNYDPSLPAAQDYDLWTRVLRHSDGANLREPLVSYRLHSGQVTRRRREEQLGTHDAISLRAAQAELPGIDLDEKQVRDVRSLFHGGSSKVADPTATAALYLNTLAAFLRVHRSEAAQVRRLARSEALFVTKTLARKGLIGPLARLGPLLLRVGVR